MKFKLKPVEGKVDLRDIDPKSSGPFRDETEAEAGTHKDLEVLYKLHYRMFAENRRSLLVVLQGIDASGKDGTVRHIFAGANPQGCTVHSFKRPSEEELEHDYLWRVHAAAPARGSIAIFNRSHYEEVMAVRVHPEYLGGERLPPEIEHDPKLFEKRFEQIRQFEKMLVQNGTVIVKFLLHISKDEQKKRLEERLDEPSRQWKFSEADIAERKFWNDYQRAFARAISETSTKHAPWYVIPSDHKWYRNHLVSRVLVNTLSELKMEFPRLKLKRKNIRIP